MDIPDWLWQNVVADLLTEGLPLTVWLAWHHREAILSKLGRRQPVLLSGTVEGGGTFDGTLTVGKSVDLRWKVEAPTPSLARRLEDLAAWYFHVS